MAVRTSCLILQAKPGKKPIEVARGLDRLAGKAGAEVARPGLVQVHELRLTCFSAYSLYMG